MARHAWRSFILMSRLDLPDSDVDAMFDSLQQLRALGDDVVI